MNKNTNESENVIYLPCNEIDFIDMQHTIDWLLETVTEYGYTEAIANIVSAKRIIQQKQKRLFRRA